MRKYIIIGAILLLISIPIIVGLFMRSSSVTPVPVTLNYWIVEGSENDYKEIVTAFQSYHPYVTVNFRELKIGEYEEKLIQAWARDQGPDIFTLPSTWVKKYQEFIKPMPSKITTSYYETKKVFFRNTTQINKVTKISPTTRDIQNDYIDIIYDDIVYTNTAGVRQIYGLPYSIDTLALYYNKDLLNNAFIVEPAKTWNELVSQSSKLTLLDNQNNILQSAIALGLSSNINHYYEILSLLMMQNGASMISTDGETITFDDLVETESLGARALEFYSTFANFNKETYSWNSSQPKSLDSFNSGKSAYYIGILADKKEIERTGGLNYGITSMFHITPGLDRVINQAGNPVQINFGKYWVHTVAKKSSVPQEAWDLVQFIARENRNKEYIEKTGQISPLKSILKDQVNNQGLEIWANQALTAKNWYTGRDATAVENYFAKMIDSVALENQSVYEAINLAAEKIEFSL